MAFRNLRWCILLIISLFLIVPDNFISKADAKGLVPNLLTTTTGRQTKRSTTTTTTTTATTTTTKRPKPKRKHAILRKVVKVVTTTTEEEEDCRSHGGSPCETDDQCCLGRCSREGFCPTAKELVDDGKRDSKKKKTNSEDSREEEYQEEPEEQNEEHYQASPVQDYDEDEYFGYSGNSRG